MKLVSNKFNIDALKIIIALKLKNIQIKEVHLDLPNSCENSFPEFFIKEGFVLSSSNASVVYLFSLDKSFPYLNGEDDRWLDWEALCLKPCVLRIISCKNFNELKPELELLLKELAPFIKKNKLPTLDQITPAFICIWCTLYPLIKMGMDINADYLFIVDWIKHLEALEPFKVGIFQVFGNEQVIPKYQFSTLIKVDGISKPLETQQSTNPESPKKEIEVTESEVIELKSNWVCEMKDWIEVKKHPLLPVSGKKNRLITSALPYVNNVPHLGNIVGSVLSADVFSRYCYIAGYNSLYVCGTDEYGTATETKALEEGSSPREICDKYHAIHKDVYNWFRINFDAFGRTTTDHQTKIVQDLFWSNHKNENFVEDSVDQLYCSKCERFLADRFVEGICPSCSYEDARGDQCDKCGKLINAIELIKPQCKLCKDNPAVKTSRHLFLDLPKIEPSLKSWVREVESGWTHNAKTITESWFKEGLKSRCITRDLKWGTPVPMKGYEDKVFYVWFDAPIGYLSITKSYTNDWEKWWKNPDQVTLYQFMAKDNVPFHSVIFPSILLGSKDKFTKVSHLISTEYLNYEDGKFSKSRGVGVFGNDAMETGIPADIWRFYLLYIRPESQDSSFSWADLIAKNNTELLNNLGNFVNRSLSFLDKNFNGIVPPMLPLDEEWKLLALIQREIVQYIEVLENVKLKDGIKHIFNISRLGNLYMQSSQPWVLMKGSEEDKCHAGTVIGILTNISFVLALLLYPYMPGICDEIRQQMNITDRFPLLSGKFHCFVKAGHKIGKPKPLFQKLDESYVMSLREKYMGKQTSAPTIKETASKVLEVGDSKDIDLLNKQVADQGEKVRGLKTSKAEKYIIDQEVSVLLSLKKQLCIAQGIDPDAQKSSKKNKKK